MGSQKITNCPQDATIDVILCFPACHQLTLGDEQRMVAAFDNVKLICRFHFLSNAFQQVQWAEPVASSLHEQNRCCQSAKHVCPELFPIAATTERVTQTDNSGHHFLERQVASDPRPKALPDKNRRPAVLLAGLNQRFAMGPNELRERIGTFSSFLHIRIVEKKNGADRAQLLRPMLHPWMARGGTGAMSKYKDRRLHAGYLFWPGLVPSCSNIWLASCGPLPLSSCLKYTNA